jgi:hypothetical protein
VSTGLAAHACPWRWAALFGLALMALGPSCGYSTGLELPEHQRSIGIEYFVNDSLERNVEVGLYNEMSRAIRDWADAPIVAPEQADVIVRGKITAYHRRSGIRSTGNELLETAIFVDAEAALYRAGSDTPLRGPVHASSNTGYIVGPIQNEDVARERTLHNLADKLVLDLFAPLN